MGEHLRRDIHTIVDKLTSVRSIVSVMVIWTICYVTVRTVNMLFDCLNSPEQFTAAKDVFIYVMGIVSGISGSIVTLYFTRQDRKTDDNKGGNNV